MSLEPLGYYEKNVVFNESFNEENLQEIGTYLLDHTLSAQLREMEQLQNMLTYLTFEGIARADERGRKRARERERRRGEGEGETCCLKLNQGASTIIWGGTLETSSLQSVATATTVRQNPLS